MGSSETTHFHATLSALDRIENARTNAELRDIFSSEIARYGYEHFVFASSRIQRSSFIKMVMLEKWPRGWMQQYQNDNFVVVDPVVKLTRTSYDAFTWDEAAVRDDSTAAKRVMRISAEDYNLRHGFSVPVHGTDGYQATVSLSGRDVELTGAARRAIEMMSLFAYKAVLKLRSKTKSYVLTPREREVIAWAAAGKSAWDTSEILHISEQTVKTHISSVLAKLEVCSKTQAVAESIRRGEIRP